MGVEKSFFLVFYPAISSVFSDVSVVNSLFSGSE